MELEEMKSLWIDMSQKFDQQKILTDKLIVDMTQKRYRNKLRGISIYEISGVIICFVIVCFIMINFKKLDTWYLIVSGILSVLFLIILPIFSLKSIRFIKQINISNNTYKQSLIDFAKGKERVIYIQKLNYYLSFPFLFLTVIISQKIINGGDIFLESDLVGWYVMPFAIVLQLVFSKWVFRKYKNTIVSAETILKEVEN